MDRPRTVVLLTMIAAAAVSGLLAPSAQAMTPSSALKSDLNYVQAAEAHYAKAHHGLGKTVRLKAGQSTYVGSYKVTSRGKETITVTNGAQGRTSGFCLTVYYPPAQEFGSFAYYDSILKSSKLKTYGTPDGGACSPPPVVQARMRNDLTFAVRAVKEALSGNNTTAGYNFTLRYGGSGYLVDSRYSTIYIYADLHETLVGRIGKMPRTFCITSTDPYSGSLTQHAYHYDSAVGSIKPGAHGTTSSNCAP